jgi:hypothetical protein
MFVEINLIAETGWETASGGVAVKARIEDGRHRNNRNCCWRPIDYLEMGLL